MVSVDSSGWIEYFLNGPLAEPFAEVLDGKEPIVTPTVVVYETYKIIKRYAGSQLAIEAVEKISKTHLIYLTEELACEAADRSLEHGLSMADAIVYATAKAFGARLVTSDEDFKGLPDVTYINPEEEF